jgi:hypothetical protein
MKHRTLVVSLGGAMLLLGCSSLAPTGPLAVQPTLTLRNSGGVDAEAMYFLGRAYQERGRHQDAVRAFRAALAVEPRHAEAHNALGASYFALGQTAQAEQQFRAAIDAAPELAHLRNNLARLYTLSGHEPTGPAPAVAAAPAAAVGSAPPAVAVAPAASVAPQAMASAPSAVVVATPAPAAISAPPTVAPASPVPAVNGRLLSVASNVWELKMAPPATPAVAVSPLPSTPVVAVRTAAAVPPPSTPVVAARADAVVLPPSTPVVAVRAAAAVPPPSMTAVAAPRPANGQRVEVSNGNGVPGLARRVAHFIETQGYRPPRTNNLQPFNQRRTELQYRIGARRQARELAALLTVTPRLVAVTSLERAATVRLVLGRDFKEPAKVAGAAPGEQLADMVAMLETK